MLVEVKSYRGSGDKNTVVDRNPGLLKRISSSPEPFKTALFGQLWSTLWERLRRLPAGAVTPLARVVAAHASRRPSERLCANLYAALGEEPGAKLVRDSYGSHVRSYLEMFRTADVDPVWLAARSKVRGIEHLDQVLDRGNGAIVLLAHHGSWDTAARWAETHNYHLACVAEVLRPRAIFEKFVTMREAIGLEIVPLGHDDSMDRLEKVLKANHLVGLLADRSIRGNGVDVTFFGRPARLPAGPAVLASRTGAGIVPITMLQRPGMRYELVVLNELRLVGDVTTDTQRVAAALEALITLDVTQWHAFQRVFADTDDSE